MDTYELAATVIAGTALVLSPIDLHPVRPTEPLPTDATLAIARIERALAAPGLELADRTAKALGFRDGWTPREYLGETLTHIEMWSQHELSAVYERVGGTVTTRDVRRSIGDDDAVWMATEITLTVDLPGIGYIELVTDWDEPSGGRDLSVMRQIADVELIAA